METSAFGIPDSLLASEQPPELIYESGSGYCRVYSGVRNGRRIALKALKPEYRDSAIHRELLRKEYEIGHTLYHPNIASTLGFEDVEGLGPAIVMEYVDGITLEEYLTNNGPMDRAAAMAVTAQICDALAYLHSHQLIHRDLKPANVMLTHSGRYVKLIDFGLSDGTAFTNYKYAGGTLHYSAPEQLAEGTDNDPRVDIYSLGVIMRKMCSDCKGGYRKVAFRCSSENPDDRPADASKIPGAIRRIDLKRRRSFIALSAVAVATILAVLIRNWPAGISSEPVAQNLQVAVPDTITRVIHDTVRIDAASSEIPVTSPEIPPAATAVAPAQETQPAMKTAELQETISKKQIDVMVKYARNYVRSELEKWYSSDSARFSFNDYRLIQHLDRYVEEQCHGDATAIALVKPAVTETAYATMRKFYSARYAAE